MRVLPQAGCNAMAKKSGLCTSNGHHVRVIDGDALGGRSSTPLLAEEREPWWSPERAALFRWLDRVAPQLAPIYLGALRLAMDEGFPGRVRYIAHSIREIRNRLPDAIDGALKLPMSNYRPYVASLQEQWVAHGFAPDGIAPTMDASSASGLTATETVVSAEFVRAVALLMAEHSRVTVGREALEAPRFEAMCGPGPHPAYVLDGLRRATDSVHKFAHVGDAPLPPAAEAEWTDRFSAFEGFLMTISRGATESLDAADYLLRSANRQ